MSAVTKRNAAPSGEGRGAKTEGSAETQANYRTDATASTAAPTPAAKDRRPWLGRDRTEWLLQVAMHEATKLSSLRVAMQIALLADADGRVCRTQEQVGDAIGMDARVIRRAMKELADAGHLMVRRSGGAGHANIIQLVIRPGETGQSGHPNRTRVSSFEGAANRTFQVAKPDKLSMETGQSGSQTGQIVSNQAENPNENKRPKNRLIAYRESIGRVRKHSHSNSKSLSCTSSSDTVSELKDVHTRAPDGACTASKNFIDEDLPLNEPPPIDQVPDCIREQWIAEEAERQYDGHDPDEGEPPPEHILPDHEPDDPNELPDEDRAPDHHASKEVQVRPGAAPRAPVEDDDEPAEQPLVTLEQARILHAIATAAAQGGHDPIERDIWEFVAEHADIYRDEDCFWRPVKGLVAKGFARYDESRWCLAITAEGMKALATQKDFWPLQPPDTTSGDAKPTTRKLGFVEDDDSIPF